MVKHSTTLFDKVWNAHLVTPPTADQPAVLYIDLHLIHEVTSPQAFDELRRRKLVVRRRELTIATMDHSTPTTGLGADGRLKFIDQQAEKQVDQLRENCRIFGIDLFPIGSPNQGIVHVIGPELGLTQPGKTIVCGDSHTSTHGAFGALAFGIGTTEVGHVLATQCLLQKKPKTMAISVKGRLQKGVTAKDLILAIIAKIGVGGGTGSVLEYRGKGIRALSMEQRMTICNMSIEAGARAGMVAPDDTTINYLANRPFSPQGKAWDDAVADWRALTSDPEAQFDREVEIDASLLTPMITYGTNPGQSIPIRGVVPDASADLVLMRALRYMNLSPGKPVLDQPIDVVFIGSCTNSRIEDLRLAAGLMKGRQVPGSVRVLVVPGSEQVRRQAEAEGLDQVFRDAGAEWRHAGCSMCIAMNGDQLQPGQYAVSTSNRNFEGRQGAGGRTFLASPLTAAAAAVTGKITDPRELMA